MNKSNCYPPNPENCCCYCSSKKDYSPRSFKGAFYSESSPSEDNGDDNECGNQTFRNIDGAITRDEIYDNLLDMIDDQMISTMSVLRKKARKFMKSEFEQSFSSGSTSHHCSHKESNHGKDTNVMKKANEIDYQPQSTFLKKMVQQYQCRQIDMNDSNFPGLVEKGTNVGNKDQNLHKPKSPAITNQSEKSDGCCCKCHTSAYGKEENSQKKSQHMSRSKKKMTGGRKRRSGGKCGSSDRRDPNLKQPQKNSCERCWRFASPSRSPVNKPDQRYDPNYRRGHSFTNLDAAKAADFADEKVACTLQNKDELDTTGVTKNIWQTLTSTPKSTTSKKLNQVQSAPCEDYSPQFTPFNKAGVSRIHNNEQPKPGNNEAKTFDFEYPSMWLSETFRNQQRKCAPRPSSYDKPKEKDSLEKGIIYSSKVRNLLNRPQNLILAKCNANREEEEEEEYGGSQSYRDACGRGRLEDLDPCIKKSHPAKNQDPCQNENFEISKLRGEGSSAENGLGGGLNGLGSGLGMGRNEFDETANFTELSEIPIDPMGQLGGQAFDDLNNFDKSKPGTARDNALLKRPSSETRSKSKVTKKNPLGEPKAKSSPRESRNKKGGGKTGGGKTGDNKRGTCLTNEAQAYFKIPDDSSNTPEECGVAHPVRHCRCYPRIVDENKGGDIYCCHCSRPKNERNEIRTNNAYVNPEPNEGYCSSRPTYPEPSAYQGRRPSPSRLLNQKPTLPNIDEYPEQLYDINVLQADGTELAVPCPYRMYMANRPLNDSTNVSQPRCQNRNLQSGNENFSFRDGNVPFRNQNANFPQMNGNENCPRYGNGNASYMTYNMASQMNGMEFPRKYCVMYMTKGKAATGDDVEVLVEELSQPCPYGTDDRMTNVKEKMTRMYKCPSESMALRFQKGVPPRASVPQKSRVLYF